MVSRPKTTSSQSGEERRQKRRQAIVQAATKLFASLGYADCEMEKVASKLRIAKGTLYLYFKGKEELFYACVDAGMVQMQEAVRAESSQAADPFQRIAFAIRAYLTFFDTHPELVELLIQERANFRSRKRPTYFEYRDANRGPWRDMYQSLVDQGRLRSDLTVERMLDTIGNLLYGTMFTNQFIGRTLTLEEQCEATVQVVFRGIMSDGERSR